MVMCLDVGESSNVSNGGEAWMCPQEKQQNHRMFSRITSVTLTG